MAIKTTTDSWHALVSQLRDRLANTLMVCDQVLTYQEPSEELKERLLQDLKGLDGMVRRLRKRQVSQRTNGHGTS